MERGTANRSGSPVLSERTFDQWRSIHVQRDDVMSFQGTVNKTAVLLAIVVATASITWKMVMDGNQMAYALAIGGSLLGFILAIVLCFKPQWAPVIGPVYAVLEGLFLGVISAIFNQAYNGIVLQAVGLTFGVMFSLLMAYKSRLIVVTDTFRLVTVGAMAGLILFSLFSLVMTFAFHFPMPAVYSNGPWGIAFSGIVVVIAAMNLVLNFDLVEQGVKANAPKFMEWYCAFSLMVALVWLYLRILNLLAKLQRRD